MRREYTPPPGYRGSRFVDRDGKVRAVEDRDYTLSVGGIPTDRMRGRTSPRRGVYSSPKRDTRAPNDRQDEHKEETVICDEAEECEEECVEECFEEPCVHDELPTPLRDCDEEESRVDHDVMRKKTESPSIFSLFGENGDLLLILLIILLSGEENTGNLVLIFAILLAIR